MPELPLRVEVGLDLVKYIIDRNKKPITPPLKWENPHENNNASWNPFLGDEAANVFGDRYAENIPYITPGETTKTLEGISIRFSSEPYIDKPSPRRTLAILARKDEIAALGSGVQTITALTIQGENVDKQINLSDIVPSGYTVLYKQSKDSKGSMCIFGDKTIIMRSNLASLSGILTLLHETGHARRSIYMDEQGDKKTIRLLEKATMKKGLPFTTSEEFEAVLTEERSAWAFALEQIHPFINAGSHSLLTSANIRTFVHLHALRSYNMSISEAMFQVTGYVQNHQPTPAH